MGRNLGTDVMTDETIRCELKTRAQPAIADDDEQMVKAAQSQPEAFGKLYDKYYSAIFKYIYRRTLDVSLAEDITSQTFFSALKYINGFKWRRIPFSAWLYRIATNEVNKHYKRHRQNSTVSLNAPDAQVHQLVQSLEAPPPRTDEHLVKLEAYSHLHQVLLALKPKYQAVIMLRFFEDKTISEISAITGTRQGTVKSLLHRALRQLRERLVECDWSDNT